MDVKGLGLGGKVERGIIIGGGFFSFLFFFFLYGVCIVHMISGM